MENDNNTNLNVSSCIEEIDLQKLKNIVNRNKSTAIKSEINAQLARLSNLSIKNTYNFDGIIKTDINKSIKQYKERIREIDDGTEEARRMEKMYRKYTSILHELIYLYDKIDGGGGDDGGDGGGGGDKNADANIFIITPEIEERYNYLIKFFDSLVRHIKAELYFEKKELIEQIQEQWQKTLNIEKSSKKFNNVLKSIKQEESLQKEYDELFCKKQGSEGF